MKKILVVTSVFLVLSFGANAYGNTRARDLEKEKNVSALQKETFLTRDDIYNAMRNSEDGRLRHILRREKMQRQRFSIEETNV